MIRKLLQQSVNYVPWKLRDRIRHVPGLASFQRWLISNFASGKEFEHIINAGPGKGLKVWVKLPEDKGLWAGTYETSFVGEIAREVKRGGTCLDVGSYHGFVGGVMAARGAGKVICFDPLPGNITAIQKLIELNPTLCIEVRGEAIGEKDGNAFFEILKEGSMGKLHGSQFQPNERGLQTIPVRIRSLDALYLEGAFDLPDLIKIDVEGAEDVVLAGGQVLLRKANPILFIEAHSSALKTACMTNLAALGYQVQMLNGSGASALNSAGVSHLKASKRP